MFAEIASGQVPYPRGTGTLLVAGHRDFLFGKLWFLMISIILQFVCSKEATFIDIFSKFEDLVVDVEDYVTLNLRDYYKINSTALFASQPNLEVEAVVSHAENTTCTDSLGFDYQITSRRSNTDGDKTVIEHYINFWNFNESAWKQTKGFRRFCLNISVVDYQDSSNPVLVEYSIDCQFVQIKVICKDKILDSVRASILEKQFLYNPGMKAEFALNFMNELPSALNYVYQCNELPEFEDDHQNDEPDPDSPSIPVGKQITRAPQAEICRGSAKNYSDMLFAQSNSSSYWALNDLLVQYNPDHSYLRLFEFESVDNRNQLTGIKLDKQCTGFKFFEYDDKGILMVCTLPEEILIHLFLVDREKKTVHHDTTVVPGKFDYCAFGHVAKFLACRVLELDGKSTVGKLIRHFKIEIFPLLAIKIGELSTQDFLDKYERTLVSNQTRFDSVTFFQLEPCPKIPTTLVINSELKNATGVYLYTLHIDMKEMPKSFNIITVHMVGPKGNTPSESIRICGFKTNMIIANITSGNLYSDSSELSKLHFTKKYHENGEFLADHCFPEQGYYAYVIGGQYPSVEKTPKRIIIFNGNNIMNLNSRIFGVFDIPEGHKKYIIKVSSKMRGIAVISYSEGTSATMVNNSRMVFQRFDYPSPTITTNAAGKYNCTLKISEPKNIFASSANNMDNDVAANFSVDVHRWSAFHANWSHRVPATIDRKQQIQEINLEQMLDISGPLFSADLRLHQNATGDKQAIRLLPRFQTELHFADEFGRSDFLDIQYISDQAILVVCDGAVKLLTVSGEANAEQNQKVKLLPNTTLNIINLDSMTDVYPDYRIRFLTSVKFNFTNPDDTLLMDMINFGLLYQLSSDATDVSDSLVLVLVYVNVSENRVFLNPYQPFVTLMDLKAKNVDIEQPQMLVANVSINRTQKRLFWAFLSQNRTVLESHGTALYLWKQLGIAYLKQSDPMYFNLSLDRYNMRNPYFRVEQFHLTYYLNDTSSEKYFMQVLSSDALMLMSMCPDGLSQTIRFFNYNLGQLGDMVSAFACSVPGSKCVLSLKGGSIVALSMTNEYKLWKLTDLNQKTLLPSKYAFKQIILGKDIMVGYNFDYEDYMFFYNKVSREEGLQYPYITLRKEYGYQHKLRYISGDQERILITNGNSMGQVLSLCNLTLWINNTLATKHDISKIGLALNLLGESEQYVNSTQLLNPPFLYVGDRTIDRDDSTKSIIILVVSVVLLLMGICFNNLFYQLNIQDMVFEKKLEISKSSELSIASSKSSTLITRDDSMVASPNKTPGIDWARRTVEAARVMPSTRPQHKTYFSSTMV